MQRTKVQKHCALSICVVSDISRIISAQSEWRKCDLCVCGLSSIEYFTSTDKQSQFRICIIPCVFRCDFIDLWPQLIASIRQRRDEKIEIFTTKCVVTVAAGQTNAKCTWNSGISRNVEIVIVLQRMTHKTHQFMAFWNWEKSNCIIHVHMWLCAYDYKVAVSRVRLFIKTYFNRNNCAWFSRALCRYMWIWQSTLDSSEIPNNKRLLHNVRYVHPKTLHKSTCVLNEPGEKNETSDKERLCDFRTESKREKGR